MSQGLAMAAAALGVRVIKTPNQACFGYPGIKKQMFVVVPVRALTLNCGDPPSSMPCLSPGLLAYQSPLSPPPQVISRTGRATLCRARQQRGDPRGAHGELTLPSAPLYLSVYCTFCACTLCSLSGHKICSMQAREPCQFRAVLVLHKRGEAGGETNLGWFFAPPQDDAG